MLDNSLPDTPGQSCVRIRKDANNTCVMVGQEGQRRYVLLCLWMAAQGAGLVPPRNIILSMRRLRVTCVCLCILFSREWILTWPAHVKVHPCTTNERNKIQWPQLQITPDEIGHRRQDIEIEMDRFEGARTAACKKYTFMDRPQGSAQEKADIAVDALATLTGVCRAGLMLSLQLFRAMLVSLQHSYQIPRQSACGMLADV